MAKHTLQVGVDFRIVSAALAALIVAMLLMWRPWSAMDSTARTIEVTGETTLSARPDEFVFYPTYEVKGSDRQTALDQLAAKTDTIVAALKDLGVPDSKIKTNASGYDSALYYNDKITPTYTTQLTITVDNETLAQKVQDYLLTTSPTGSVTPQAGFSEKKSKELENKARNTAAVDARAKAEQMGKNLGFRLGKVKAITDGGNFSIYTPTLSRGVDAMSGDGKSTAFSLGLQPGENELPYSVTVVYYIK